MTQKRRLLKRNNPPGISIDKLISSSSKDARLIETKHQKIIEGACSVLFGKGYHVTTIREIAKACGMSMGQLYHYISSKDDILYLVHKYMQKIWHEHLEKSGIEEIEDPLQKLINALRYTLEFIIKNKKLIQFVYTETKYLNKKHLRVILELDDKNVVGFFYRLLKNVNKQKPIKGELSFNAKLITFITAFLALRSWNIKDKSIMNNIDSLIDFILKGIGIYR